MKLFIDQRSASPMKAPKLAYKRYDALVLW
jgi:hypothetical protein